MAAIGWYGPLIDLSKASSHIGDFVQLLVFVHRSIPVQVQYKLSKGGEVIRTDIQVGDDSRQFFSVSLWQREMGSIVCAGDVILLQNVKITKFGDAVEAKTVQCSSLLCLIHPYESLVLKGMDDLIMDCRVGITTKEKLRKVIEWAKRAASSLHRFHGHSNKTTIKNWKVQEEREPRDCFSLSEVSRLSNSCKATFFGSIGEIFLPFTWRALGEYEKERMFISRRVFEMGENSLAEDLICTGCQLCGSPLCSEHGSTLQQNTAPLYCQKSCNFLHVVGFIYRPFMLYVWDETEYIPLLVKNKSAELLFGNIGADRVHLCYKGSKKDRNSNPKKFKMENQEATPYSKVVTEGFAGSCSQGADKSVQPKGKCRYDKSPNFYVMWLILLKVLLQQGKNSPLKFEVVVNASLDKEDGRFEMVSVSMPCLKT